MSDFVRAGPEFLTDAGVGIEFKASSSLSLFPLHICASDAWAGSFGPRGHPIRGSGLMLMF